MADPVTVDESILQWALRYALGRSTYAVRDVYWAVQANLDRLSDRFCRVAVADIDRAEADGALGSPIVDAPVWRGLREDLRHG